MGDSNSNNNQKNVHFNEQDLVERVKGLKVTKKVTFQVPEKKDGIPKVANGRIGGDHKAKTVVEKKTKKKKKSKEEP
ncbi:unnamed protein product [Caenorhabditis sp. 36 PRJEB53466]|nr:unnamed protein product [Caenorhabditis sp. 36 PRJEB53466]